MKTIQAIAGSVFLVATLAACSPGIHGKLGYSVTFTNGSLVAHAPNHPNAYIDSNGNLRFGDRAIAVTPTQRALLKAYYANSKSVVDDGIATGKAAVKLAGHAVGDAIAGLFDGDSQQSGATVDAKANAITVAAEKLCTGVNRLRDTQTAIATQIPEFKPYQAFEGHVQCNVTVSAASLDVAPSTPATDKAVKTDKQVVAQ